MKQQPRKVRAQVRASKIGEVCMVGAVLASGFMVYLIGSNLTFSNGSPNYIAAAVPFFLLLAGVEYIIMKATHLSSVGATYTVAETCTSMSSGTVEQLFVELIFKPMIQIYFPYLSYLYIWTHYCIYPLPVSSNITWFGTLLAIDFSYYWLHRAGHQIGIMWIGHSVHHSGEHYNLSTSLRQSWWMKPFSHMSYLPLAFFIPPSIFMFHHQWNTIYQFWVHTCTVRTLGPLELFFMTPSHHRIHHDRRLHKNFGGVLIIWDKMFGSFVDENDADMRVLEQERRQGKEEDQEEVCIFGIMRRSRTWVDATLQIEAWKSFFHQISSRKGFFNKLVPVFCGPGYYTAGAKRRIKYTGKEGGAKEFKRIRLESNLSTLNNFYVFLNFFFTISLAYSTLLWSEGPWEYKYGVGVVSVLGIGAQGKMLDGEGSGERLQGLVNGIYIALLSYFLSSPPLSPFPFLLLLAIFFNIFSIVFPFFLPRQ